MIEDDRFPVARPVAGLAFVSVRPFMFVVLLVTGITIRRSVLKGRRQVALLALHLDVLAQQWETGLVVIEGRLFP